MYRAIRALCKMKTVDNHRNICDGGCDRFWAQPQAIKNFWNPAWLSFLRLVQLHVTWVALIIKLFTVSHRVQILPRVNLWNNFYLYSNQTPSVHLKQAVCCWIRKTALLFFFFFAPRTSRVPLALVHRTDYLSDSYVGRRTKTRADGALDIKKAPANTEQWNCLRSAIIF